MASEREILSTEIVNRGIEDSGPYAGSLSFSVRVRRGLPDFLNSVKLKRETWLWLWLSHKPWHLFVTTPILIVIFSAQIGKLTWQDLSLIKFDLPNALFLTGLLALILYVYLDLMPRPTYLVDFACYRPPTELKVNQSSFIFFILF